MDGKWPKLMLMGAVTSCRLLYDLTTGTGSPRLVPSVLQCSLLVCALLALICSAAMYATDR